MTNGRGWGRWVVLAVVLVAAIIIVSRLTSDDSVAPTGARVEHYVAGPDQLAEALEVPGAVFRRSSPPVDVEQIERSARSITLNQVPLPDDREVSTYRRADTGAEFTQIVLLYDDPARAAGLDKLASSMVAGAFHMETEPTTLEGAQDARRWWADGYSAISFRLDGVVVFIGSTDTASDDVVRIAEKTLAEIIENPPTAPTVQIEGE